MSVCVPVCVCVCVHDNSKNNGSIHLKLEHIVVYENSLDKFDIGHCPIKVNLPYGRLVASLSPRGRAYMPRPNLAAV